MTTLPEAAAAVDDGDVVAFAGKTLHRAPVAFARALVRRGVRDLALVGVASSMEVDLLCGAGCVADVHFGYVGFEGLGLAPNFRRAVEDGTVTALEGTCYTVATMLRGAKQGVPFMPVAGLDGSDLAGVRDDFARIEDPFAAEEVSVVRSVTPDVGVIHALEATRDGDARFVGADLTEGLVARAADRVIVTAERIVDDDAFRTDPDRTDVAGVLVDDVVEVPYGAHPCSCPDAYDYDRTHLRDYLDRSADGAFDSYLDAYLGDDEADYRERVGVDGEALSWEPAGTGTAT